MLLTSLVSIDIGSSLIKLVELSQSSGKIRLEKVGVIENPVPNFRTEIDTTGNSTITQAIKRALRISHIKAKDVVSSLGGSSIIIQYFKFPRLSGKELQNAVYLEAQRVMSVKLSEMETGFQVLPSHQGEAGVQEILFAAAPKRMVRQRIDTLRRVGLNPMAIDIDCLAFANCFLKLKSTASNEHVLVLNLGVQLINLAILSRNGLQFIRDISLGLKTALNFGTEDILSRAVGEIRRSINYYETRSVGDKVTRVFLTGGGAVASRIDELFSSSLKLPVERWNPLKNLEFDSARWGDGFEENRGCLLTIAIGLSLREKEK